jgi:hypothetical protein
LKQRIEQGGILFKFHNMGLGYQPTLLLKLLKLLYRRASSQT